MTLRATILFTQAKGGSGKTTLLTQLAAHWLQAGRRLAIVDLDPQGTALRWCGQRARDPGLPAPAKAIESADWRAAPDLREAAAAADLVLVDTAGAVDALRGVVRDRADLVIVPCQPSMADVWATDATLTALGDGSTPSLIVLNRCPARSRAAALAETELARTGASLATARLGQRAAFAEAIMRGAGVSEMARSGKAAEEIRALAAEIEKRLVALR
ncbi:MAG: ParA family protein [Alphaproteobacteria bacterium]|nr:MAG: ParA family protein [Alphaproteobacteria bacterium]